METTEFLKKKLDEVIPQIHQNGFIAYCGAGISIPTPTCAPSWWVLTSELLKAFFNQVPDDMELPKDMILSKTLYSPEAILEIFATILDKNLFKAFEVLDVSQPNANHMLIAKLAKAGTLKIVITTNFDRYIERALQAEGVPFELLVDNEQYDALYQRLITTGFQGPFLVCKIHGTVERPDTIVSLASAYKSLKGFSPAKARVFKWFLSHYSCLFLGYSGWDFEHINYRKFWEQSGSSLQGIYWNRRVGETGGPKFPVIFNTCKQKFVFTESELPNGWLEALKQLNLSFLQDAGLLVFNTEVSQADWEKAAQHRKEFLEGWANQIPKPIVYAGVISEAVHFSAKFQEFNAVTQSEAKKLAAGPTSEEQAAESTIITQGFGKLGMQLSKQEITMDEYNKRNAELQLEMQLLPFPKSKREEIKKVFLDNRFPGYTDDPMKKGLFGMKFNQLALRYDAQKAGEIAIELLNRDQQAMMKGGAEYMVETQVTLWLAYNMDPDESKWKPQYDQMMQWKSQVVDGKLKMEEFRAKCAELEQKKQYQKMGFDVPHDKWMQMLLNAIGESKTREEFKVGCEAFNIAVIGTYARVNAELMKTAEFKALQAAVNAPPPPTAESIALQAEMGQKMAELGTAYSQGKVTLAEYQTKVVELQMAKAGPNPVPVEVPLSILQNYDKVIRAPYVKVYEKLKEFCGDEVCYEYMLLEMAIVAFWTCMQMIYVQKSQAYYSIAQRGDYPLIETHPAIVKFVKDHHLSWMKRGLQELSPRFGQVLTRFMVEFAEMGHDIDLCKEATDKSIEWENGKVDESVYMKIPVSLAAFYEEKGDKDSALHYYEIAMNAVQSSFVPPFADIIVYKAAKLTAEKGEKEKALRILAIGLPEFFGNEPPMRFQAKDPALKLAEELAHSLGLPDAKTAIKDLYKE